MNAGNVIRLCANTGSVLHLVEPLGFTMESSALKRAGLDYHDMAEVHVHVNFGAMVSFVSPTRMFAFSSSASRRYDQVAFEPTDVLVFGAERAGLTPELMQTFSGDTLLRLPMRPNNRSLNLANSVAIVVFEAWRQQGFYGSSDVGSPLAGQGLNAELLTSVPFDS